MSQKNGRETINAKISDTFLGWEDHGLLTGILTLEGDGWGQSFGLYSFGSASRKVKSGWGMEFVRRTLEVVGVDSWEKLKNKHVRIERDHDKIHRLGHITKNEWFEPAIEAKTYADD